MRLYIIKRLLLAVPTIVVVSIIIFLLIHIAPGDPVRVMLGPIQDDVLVQRIREQLGLNLPLYQQYFRWAGNALHGDFGFSVSVHRGAPVIELLLQRYLVTLELAFLSMIIATLIAFPAGILSAIRQNTWVDHTTRIIALLGISTPSFFLGILFILFFGVHLLQPWATGGFVPISEGLANNLLHLLLPSIALGAAFAAIVMRMLRSSMLDVMGSDYVRTSRAMGIPRPKMIRRDIVKNALIPVITVMGNAVGYLLAGSIVTETVFRLPGVGNLVINAVYRRDFPVIQGIVLSIVVIRILVNLIVDVVYAAIDPRIRYGRVS